MTEYDDLPFNWYEFHDWMDGIEAFNVKRKNPRLVFDFYPIIVTYCEEKSQEDRQTVILFDKEEWDEAMVAMLDLNEK